MQNYSQALDLDMLNRRYWYRRMQQCKAEFKTRQPHSMIPSSPSPSFSNKIQPPSSKNWVVADGPNRSSAKPIVSKSAPPSLVEQPAQVEPSIQLDPRLIHKENGATNEIAKGRPIPAQSKPSRPIKYQVR